MLKKMEPLRSLFDKKSIENLIPQKQPFIMVDKMFFYSDNSLVSGLKIDKDNVFCDNKHFAESGLIEHMAQTVALHKGYDVFLKNEIPPIGFIGSLKNIEIFALPKTVVVPSFFHSYLLAPVRKQSIVTDFGFAVELQRLYSGST